MFRLLHLHKYLKIILILIGSVFCKYFFYYLFLFVNEVSFVKNFAIICQNLHIQGISSKALIFISINLNVCHLSCQSVVCFYFCLFLIQHIGLIVYFIHFRFIMGKLLVGGAQKCEIISKRYIFCTVQLSPLSVVFALFTLEIVVKFISVCVCFSLVVTGLDTRCYSLWQIVNWNKQLFIRKKNRSTISYF